MTARLFFTSTACEPRWCTPDGKPIADMASVTKTTPAMPWHQLQFSSIPSFNVLTLLVGRQERQSACVKLGVGLLVVTIWLKLCTSYSSSCTTSIILSSNKIQNGYVLVLAMEVKVTIGAIRRAKLQSNRHHQPTNTQFFTGRMPFLSPNQHVRALKNTSLTTTNYYYYYKSTNYSEWRFSVAVTRWSLSTQLLYIESV